MGSSNAQISHVENTPIKHSMGFIQTHSEISEAFTQSVSYVALLIVIRSFENILLLIRVQCVTEAHTH